MLARLALVACLLAPLASTLAHAAHAGSVAGQSESEARVVEVVESRSAVGERAVEGKAWASLRGPHGNGSVASGRELESLALAWKHSIGPGYSGVVVAGGRAVTAFSDGRDDVVAAWSTTDGRELWRTKIGPTYRGHDGSTDGPVGTPSLTDERVYLIGPRGDLVALSIASG